MLTLKRTDFRRRSITRSGFLRSGNHRHGTVYAMNFSRSSYNDLSDLEVEHPICFVALLAFFKSCLICSDIEERDLPPQPISRIVSSFWTSSHCNTTVANFGTKEATFWYALFDLYLLVEM